tara:strand:+ start:516 stop:1064 length:549 start_codon:yes stop_codon:yes gene_type:complete
MKVDLFPTPVRKYNVPNNDKHLSHWTKEYNDSKFEEVSPLVLGYTHIDRRLSESYIDIINEFVNDIGVSETHSYTIQSYIFKCLEKGEGVDSCDFLPSHYTFVHYLNDCKKSDLFYHPSKQIVRSYDPIGVADWIWDTGLYVNAGDVIIYPSYLETASPKNDLTDPRMTVTLPIVLRLNEQG